MKNGALCNYEKRKKSSSSPLGFSVSQQIIIKPVSDFLERKIVMEKYANQM